MKKLTVLFALLVSSSSFASTTVCSAFCVTETTKITGRHDLKIEPALSQGSTKEAALDSMKSKCASPKRVVGQVQYLRDAFGEVHFGTQDLRADQNISCIEI